MHQSDKVVAFYCSNQRRSATMPSCKGARVGLACLLFALQNFAAVATFQLQPGSLHMQTNVYLCQLGMGVFRRWMAAFWPSRNNKKQLACSNETFSCICVCFVTVYAYLPHRHEVE